MPAERFSVKASFFFILFSLLILELFFIEANRIQKTMIYSHDFVVRHEIKNETDFSCIVNYKLGS